MDFDAKELETIARALELAFHFDHVVSEAEKAKTLLAKVKEGIQTYNEIPGIERTAREIERDERS